jgi:hypothetical protein
MNMMNSHNKYISIYIYDPLIPALLLCTTLMMMMMLGIFDCRYRPLLEPHRTALQTSHNPQRTLPPSHQLAFLTPGNSPSSANILKLYYPHTRTH